MLLCVPVPAMLLSGDVFEMLLVGTVAATCGSPPPEVAEIATACAIDSCFVVGAKANGSYGSASVAMTGDSVAMTGDSVSTVVESSDVYLELTALLLLRASVIGRVIAGLDVPVTDDSVVESSDVCLELTALLLLRAFVVGEVVAGLDVPDVEELPAVVLFGLNRLPTLDAMLETPDVTVLTTPENPDARESNIPMRNPR